MSNDAQNSGRAEEIGESLNKSVSYKIQVDKQHLETRNPTPTGAQILELANKKPVAQFALYLKTKGSQPQRIGLDEHIDLRKPGTERFVTLPLDQTEGQR